MSDSQISTHLPPLMLAIAGGMADFLTSDDHTQLQMIVSIFLAGFAGYMALLLCIEWDLSEGQQGVMCGICGLSSRAIIQILRKVGTRELNHRLGVNIDTDKLDDVKSTKNEVNE